MRKMMKIRLVHSTAGAFPKHRDTVRGLGLRHVYHERVIVDTPETRGMVKAVNYLVKVVEENVTVTK